MSVREALKVIPIYQTILFNYQGTIWGRFENDRRVRVCIPYKTIIANTQANYKSESGNVQKIGKEPRLFTVCLQMGGGGYDKIRKV